MYVGTGHKCEEVRLVDGRVMQSSFVCKCHVRLEIIVHFLVSRDHILSVSIV